MFLLFLEQKLAMKHGHIRFNGVGDLYDVSGPVTTLCSLVQIKLAAVHKDLAINIILMADLNKNMFTHTVTSCYDVFCFPNS